MSINVTFAGEDSDHLRSEILRFLGIDHTIFQGVQLTGIPPLRAHAPGLPLPPGVYEAAVAAENEGVRTVAAPPAGPVTPGRERGKAAPGKQRRTAAEVAEDKALDEADAAGGTGAANISSGGEDRVDPADQEIGAEDTADEEADGIGDMDQSGDDTPVVRTHDDLRRMIGNCAILFKNDMLAVQMAFEPAFAAAGCKPQLSTVPPEKVAAVFDKMREIGARLEADPAEILSIAKRAAAAQGKA